MTDFDDQREGVTEPVFAMAQNGVTVSLSNDERAAIRKIAAARGVDEAALIHEWVQENCTTEARSDKAVTKRAARRV